MTRLRFDHSDFELDVAPGAHIVDVTDQHPRADVRYSCRAANCGTCRVHVLEGAEAFPPPEEDERGVLDLYDAPSDVRLCCQLRIVNEVPRIVLRAVDD